MTDLSSSVVRCPSPDRPSPGCPAAGAAVPRDKWYPAGGRAVPGGADLTGRPESRVDACGPGREASPPCRPASAPAAAPVAAGPRRRSPPGTPRPALPAFPCGRAGPPGQALPVRSRGTSRPRDRLSGLAWLLISAGGQPRRAFRAAGRTRAGAGLDRAGGAERPSSRTHGRAAPGTRTAPGRPPATPDADPGTPADPLLTIEEVTAELQVSRAAFYRWRRQGAGPAVVRLPGGGVRVRRSALTAWLRRLENDTQDGQEQGTDGQLRRQVLGHQEDRRQRQRRPVPGPVGRR